MAECGEMLWGGRLKYSRHRTAAPGSRQVPKRFPRKATQQPRTAAAGHLCPPAR